MPVLAYRDSTPQIGRGVFLAPTAFVIGDVSVGDGSSIWFGSTVRADTGSVRIGANTNIQENSTIHTEGGTQAVVGDGVSMGHHALVHAATVEDDVLVGMNASVLSGARVGRGSIVAAHAVVVEGARIPPDSLVVGVPGKVLRPATDADLERIRRTARAYEGLTVEYIAMFAGGS